MKYVLILFSFSILLIGGCTNNNTPKSHPLPPISENSPLRKPKILSNEEKIEKNLEKIGYKKDCNNIT